MRIITGTCKGRKLKTPRDDRVRPTPDRIKEAVFSMLAPYLSEDTVFADVFCGTGSMGLEALSRGVKRVYFSDHSKEILRFARQNIALCNAEDRSVVLQGDYRSNLERIQDPVDIYFLDPPFQENLMLAALEAIAETPALKPEVLVVCEHHKRLTMPEELSPLYRWKFKRYGATSISVYRLAKRG